jgi:DNA repair exonuclease SbcCD ATPase subunit
MNADELERAMARLEAERAHALATLREEESRLEEAREALEHAQEAQGVLQGVAEATQRLAHERLAGAVSSCLRAIFDDAYLFTIDFEKKRGRTEAVLRFSRDGESFDPLASSGGGAIDVAAAALRAACLTASRPALRKLLVLDEPFKYVSKGYRPAARALVERLAEDAGIQFVIVTHSPDFETGEVVEL